MTVDLLSCKWIGWCILLQKMALIQPLLDKKVLNHHMTLEQPEDKIQALYIWIDGTGQGLRCKTKTVNGVPKTVEGMHFCGVNAIVSKS